MKTCIVVLALAVSLPVYGEQKSPQTTSSQQPPQNLENYGASPSTQMTEQQNATKKSGTAQNNAENYLVELFSANNLPNLLLFFAGLGGIVVGICTLKAIRDQSRIAKDALIASERPKLGIKHISLAIESLDDPEWKIGCIVANVGGSKATIIETDLTISRPVVGTLESSLIGIPHYDRKYSFGSFSIEPGERQERTITLDANDRLRFNLAHGQAEKRRTEGKEPLTTAPIVCFGFFRYRDERGIARLTGFGWVWNSLDMTFTRLNNPNYEYKD